MNKYIKYLNIQHNWETFNCFTIIELIYKDFLGISMSELWKTLGGFNKNKVNNYWYNHYTRDIILEEIKNWFKINLTELKEYDILVFTNRKDQPRHFGMYIANNKFIHLPSDSMCVISDLNDKYRERLQFGKCSGVYRHNDLV